MPRGDGTGPMGIGPMTGRAAGYCAGYGVPGYMNPIGGRGFGMGFGRGRRFWGGARGRRNWFYATGQPGWMRFGAPAVPYGYPPVYGQVDPEAEKQALKSQAGALQSELDAIKKRLDEIETQARAE